MSQIQELKSQVEKAVNLIGFSSVKQFDFPDNQFDSQPLLSITKAIEDTIKDKRPDTEQHHSGDLNLDHSIANRATLIARPQGGTSLEIC